MSSTIFRLSVILILLLNLSSRIYADSIIWFDGTNPVSYNLHTDVDPVVEVALQLFDSDMSAITGYKPVEESAKKSTIHIAQLDKASHNTIKDFKEAGIETDSLCTDNDAFAIICHKGKIMIMGSNGRGAAYGILELSRLAGVSPWVWWGDVTPSPKDKLTISSDYSTFQKASVAKRGIFLNDEDWTLRPWSYKHYEPGEFGEIGPKTYKRIFELLLRLRANAIWPGMHTGTKAFFKNPMNKIMADSCGIYVGTSHCEPMLRNNVDEWDEKEMGPFNYRTNKDNVHAYWIERLKEVNGSNTNMFTIGMRGIHDGSMQGYSSTEEKFDALQQVIDDQQKLVKEYIGAPEKQMQIFVPYKEVLELYEKGLNVPDYVTLVWCDDNYGYITRLSDKTEQMRSGGAGIYYHLSYWGRPHDYMWLTTTQPGLIYSEMRRAYDHNVRDLWIVNVHDVKVAAYDLELFLDMAWDINSVSPSNLDSHLLQWLESQFGEDLAGSLLPAMTEFYRLCGIRKPEFMGWSQVEVSKKTYDRGLSQVRNTEFSIDQFGGELDRYLDDYTRVVEIVDSVKNTIPDNLKSAYFAAIEYPVKCAYLNAVKMLEAQRARQLANGSTREDLDTNHTPILIACAKSQNAYYDIRNLTKFYNDSLSNGKWKYTMECNPRHLPAGCAPVLPYLLTEAETKDILSAHPEIDDHYHTIKADDVIALNACDYDTSSDGTTNIRMLGHSMNAVSIPEGGSLDYNFTSPTDGEAVLTVALIPSHPDDAGDIRFQVSIDDGDPFEFSLKEPFRSERWKTNVLRGQARRSIPVSLTKGEHTLKIKAISPNIIVDQWMIDFKNNRPTHYLIPVSI